MSEYMKASIYFFLDNEMFAFRSWNFVPRVGEEIMLGEDEDRKAYIIKRLCWGNEERDRINTPQRINIEIEHASP